MKPLNCLFACVLFLMVACCAHASESYCFRVYLNNKDLSGYRAEAPEEFLSDEAVERRRAQGIPIDASDLPIPQAYIDSLAQMGCLPVVRSKWMSTVVVEDKDSTVAERLKTLSIVDSVKWVWKGTSRTDTTTVDRQEPFIFSKRKALEDYYGYAGKQIRMLNGDKLHTAGFRGEGIRIAVIDAGFSNVDRIAAFDSMTLIGTRNFVSPGRSVYVEDDHGTKVLSCMAANLPGLMVGTAPDASYLLLKSEDTRSEYPIEEDYWAAAVEYADSLGIDLITSSLGYYYFDNKDLTYTYDDLDGKTAFSTRVAVVAAHKGLLLFSSAGNEGGKFWEKITFPGDADHIITVGAINSEGKKSSFSSKGFTADYRVKPDVVALGTSSCVIDENGGVSFSNGTSFATPILAGLGACLLQSLPRQSNIELIALMLQSADRYHRADAELGYGIPDVYEAYQSGIENVYESHQ